MNIEDIKKLIDTSKELNNLGHDVINNKYSNYFEDEYKDEYKIVEYHSKYYLTKWQKNDDDEIELSDNFDRCQSKSIDYCVEISSTDQLLSFIRNQRVLDTLHNGGIVKHNNELYYMYRSDSYDITLKNIESGSNKAYSINGGYEFFHYNIPTNEELDIFLENHIKRVEDGKANIEFMQSITKSIYGDRCCFGTCEELGLADNNFINNVILIHFPEITVRNNRLSHNIIDTYIRIDINQYGNINNTLQGIRTSMTIEEYDSNYTHSHLSSVEMGRWGNWCLGSTDLNTTVMQLSIEFNPLLFEAMLYRFPDYLSWESLGGGPYRRISSIRIRGNEISRSIPLLTKQYALINRLDELPLMTKRNKCYNSIHIDRNNNEFELLLGEYATHLCSSYMCKKDIINNIYLSNNGRSLRQIKSEIDKFNEDNEVYTLFKFNDKEIKSRIVTDIKISENEELVNVLTPTAFNSVCDIIDSQLLEYLKFKNTIKNYEQKERKSVEV